MRWTPVWRILTAASDLGCARVASACVRDDGDLGVMTNPTSPLPRTPLVDVVGLGMIVVLLVVDLFSDISTTSATHVVVEIGASLFALAIAARLGLRWWRAREELVRRVDDLGHHLRAAHADAQRWRDEAHEALQGLGAAIDAQCDRWSLTEAERTVAVLLLKGLSMKEIAEARSTTERTARQQALAVYRKAGLGGRAELSAFFLEDLLLPSPRA